MAARACGNNAVNRGKSMNANYNDAGVLSVTRQQYITIMLTSLPTIMGAWILLTNNPSWLSRRID